MKRKIKDFPVEQGDVGILLGSNSKTTFIDFDDSFNCWSLSNDALEGEYFEVLDIIKNNTEESKMMTKGIDTKISVLTARIDKENNKVKLVEKFGTNIQGIDYDERCATIDGVGITDIIKLTVDENVKIANKKPELLVKDTRREYADLVGELKTVHQLHKSGVYTIEKKNLESAKLEKKLSCVSEYVEHELVWEV